MNGKAPDAFRTISEVSDWLGVNSHVLRFWESKFTQVKPVKRAGGRRYYRRADMELLGGIQKLLHEDGMTIKGVQKVLREQGVKAVSAMSRPVDGSSAPLETDAVAPTQVEAPPGEESPAEVVPSDAGPAMTPVPENADVAVADIAEPHQSAQDTAAALSPSPPQEPLFPETLSTSQSVPVPPEPSVVSDSPLTPALPEEDAEVTSPQIEAEADPIEAEPASEQPVPVFVHRDDKPIPAAEDSLPHFGDPDADDAAHAIPPADTAPVPASPSLVIAPLPGPELTVSEALVRLVPHQIDPRFLAPIHARLVALRDRMDAAG